MKIRQYAFLLLCLCSEAMQAQSDTLSTVNMDEVVVSSKETFRYREMPASISMVSGYKLETEHITSLKGLSSYVPNLFVPDYGSKLYAPIYIRGIGTRTSTGAPSVGMYVDGVPYFETTAFDFDFFDIDHIEVLRGPQGTLYGRNTMAGIINITTPSPLSYRKSRARLSYGAYGDAKAGASYSGKIGQGLGMAASLNYNRRGGYFINHYTGKPADRRNDIAGRLRLIYGHNEQTHSDLSLSYEHSRQEGYAYRQYHPETGKTDSVNYNAPSSYTRRLLTAGYRFHRQTAWGTLRSITGYQHLTDDQTVDQDYSPRPQYVAVQKQQQNMLSQEVTAQSDFTRNYRWVTGAFAFSQWKDKNVDVQFPAMNHYMTDDQQAWGAAVYHQSGYHNLLVSGLSLTVGLRLDYERVGQRYRYDIVRATSPNPAPLPVSDTDLSLDFFQLLPKVALRYEFAKQAVYISLSKGYKTGGFNTSFREGYNEQSYRPEISWNYEAGAKLMLPGATSVNLSAFYIDWRDQQITQVVALGNGNDGTVIHNAGRSVSKGIELSAVLRPVRGLSINAHYGYTSARFTDYQYSDTIDYSGHHIPWVPQHTFSGGISYRLPLTRLDDITFQTQYNGIGTIYWHEDNHVSQKPYHLLNASISVGKGPLRLTVWARNILSSRYFVYYLEQAAVGKLVQQGPPLTFGIDAGIEF